MPREPHRRAVALRMTMAMLYAFSDGRRAPYDQFWRMCAECNQARAAHKDPRCGAGAVREAFHGICRTLNVRETGELHTYLRRALTDPGKEMRGYSAPSGPMTDDDLLPMQMADLDRIVRMRTMRTWRASGAGRSPQSGIEASSGLSAEALSTRKGAPLSRQSAEFSIVSSKFAAA